MVTAGACGFLQGLMAAKVDGAKRLAECLSKGKMLGTFPLPADVTPAEMEKLVSNHASCSLCMYQFASSCFSMLLALFVCACV